MKLADFDGTVRDEDGIAWNADRTARRPEFDAGSPTTRGHLDFYKTDIGFVFKSFADTRYDKYLVRETIFLGDRTWIRTQYGFVVRQEDIEGDDERGYRLIWPVETLAYQRDRTEMLVRQIAGLVGLERSSGVFYDYVRHPDDIRRPDGAAWHYEAMARALSDLSRYCAVKSAQIGATEAVASLGDFQREGRDEPFFSEAGLYDLVGKDDARSVLALLRQVESCVGS